MALNVRVEAALTGLVENAVSFETRLTRAQLQTEALGYDHHGSDFTPEDKGALPSFFEDLLLGRPMPPTFATPAVQDIDTLVAIALFLHRDLALHPNTPGFVSVVDFVHRRGLPALAHIEEPLARFFSALRGYFPERGLSQRELSARIISAVSWIREYVHDATIPVLGPAPNTTVRILDQGSEGFAVAETTGSLWDGWVQLYRMGFLKGILVTHQNERLSLLVAKKSHHVRFNLPLAAKLLNEMETVMGEAPEWLASSDGLWLERPSGTLILLRDILAVLSRV